MIRITRAPAYATVQDRGRRNFLAAGVPRAGAMDLATLDTLNALLGNDMSSAGIEWALTAGEIEFDSSATFAVGGANGPLSLSNKEVEKWRAFQAQAGDKLVVGAPEVGRFRYIAFAGGMQCRSVMQSRSTYLPGAFGGIDGRRIATGDLVTIGQPTRRHHISDTLPTELLPPGGGEIRFIPRNGGDFNGEWTISAASDRTGYRLQRDGTTAGGTITSEPVCPGTIQLPPGGEAIILMADAPTVGGYRIAGGVISADLGALAQCVPGERVSFTAVSIQQAQRAAEREAGRLERIREWSLT